NPHGILDFQDYSTLDGAGILTNNGRILLNSSNTLLSSVSNKDTMIVDGPYNSMTGMYTNTSASILYMRCTNATYSAYGSLTFNSGWINNGKIIMASISYYPASNTG